MGRRDDEVRFVSQKSLGSLRFQSCNKKASAFRIGALAACLCIATALRAAPNLLFTGSVGISPTTVTSGSNIQVAFPIKNSGNTIAGQSSTKIQVKPGASAATTTQIIVTTASLAPAATRTENATVTIPANTPAGSYTIYVIIDYNNSIGQSNINDDIAQTNIGALTVQAPLSPPTVHTQAASFITANTAQLNGTYDSHGLVGTIGFQYGTTIAYGSTTPLGDMGPPASTVSFNLTGLNPGTTYHYRVAASDAGGVVSGEDFSFTTTALALPTVQTLTASSVTSSSAQLNASYDSHGLVGTIYFQYGTSTAYEKTTAAGDLGPPAGTAQYPLASLTPGTTYHYRVVATDAAGTSFGLDQTFSTSANGPPQIQTLSASDLTSTSAILNGAITPHGQPSAIYFQYGLTSSYSSVTPVGIAPTTPQNIGYAISGLAPNTTYHYRFAAISAGTVISGIDQTFITPTASYTVTITPPAEVALNRSATFAGHIVPTTSESQITSWSWTFSDGGTATGQSVTHSFTGGNFGSATLRTVDSSGHLGSTSVIFNIRGNGNPVPQNTSVSRDPVNLATGNFMMDSRDLVIPGRGLPFVFERFYNSKAFAPSASTDGPHSLGWGWSHTFEMRVEALVRDDTSVSAYRVIFGDGHAETYTLSNGIYKAEDGIHNIFVKNSDGTFSLTGKNQIKHLFASLGQDGRLTSIMDRNGNTISITYDEGNKRIDSITDTVGRIVQFQYDSAGHLSAITDPIGRKIQYSVDTSHDLVAVTNARGYKTTSTYDSLHQLLTGTDPRGHVFVENTYDASRRVTKQLDADSNETDFSYSVATSPETISVTTVTRKALGGDEITAHSHDPKLRLVKRTDGRGDGYSESFEYDDTTSDLLAFVDKKGNRYEYQYDANGNCTQITYPDKGVATTTYNARNDPALKTNQNTVKEFWEYDTSGNQVARTFPYDSSHVSRYRRTWSVNSYGQPDSYTDANGNKTTFYYDAHGNNRKTTNAANSSTEREFDDVSRKVSDKDGRGNKTSYTLDANGNIEVTTFPDSTTEKQTFDENDNRTSIEDQLKRTTYFAYDNQDRISKTTDPASNDTKFGYDPLGNKVSIEQPGQGSGSVTVQIGYDLAGQQVSETDQMGKKRTIAHDKNGNVASETDADGVTVSYEYDAMNRRTKVIDAAGKETVTTYDALGQIIQVKDALGRLTKYTYNDAGQLTSVVDAAGTTFSFGYDFEGNQTSATHDGSKTRSATYTSLNQLDTSTDENGTIESRSYDAAGNLSKFVNGDSEEIDYGYDSLNRRTSISFPSGTGTTFAYFDDGRLKSMSDAIGTTAWAYTARGQVATVADPFGKTLAFTYDPNGNRDSITYPGNKKVTYTFDRANRLASMTDWNSRVSTRDYTDDGRLSAIHHPNGVNTLISYDDLGRANDIAHKKGSANAFVHFGYTFDAAGNMSSAAVDHPLSPAALPASNTYTYDSANQLATIDSGAVARDKKGDLLTGKLSPSSSSDSLTFDFQNRLTKAIIGGITTTSRYDGQDHRLEMTQGGTTRRFVVDGTGTLAQILAETDAAGAITAYYLYFGGLAERVLPDGTAVYYHADRNGSIAALTNQSGSITDSYLYDPFGVSLGSSGSSTNPFRYLGGFGVYDNGDGTLFARARHYHADLGRFLSRDPLLGDNKDGQSLNRYVYGLNSPLRFVDVNGFSSQEGNLSGANYYLSLQAAAHAHGLNSPEGHAFMAYLLKLQQAQIVTAFAEADAAYAKAETEILGATLNALLSLLPVGEGLALLENAGKAANVAVVANRIAGARAVDDFMVQAEANGMQVVGREVTFDTPFGARRIDVILRNLETGQVGGVEVKSSLGAFNRFDAAARQQFAADRWINQFGAEAVGQNAGLRIDNTIKLLWPAP